MFRLNVLNSICNIYKTLSVLRVFKSILFLTIFTLYALIRFVFDYPCLIFNTIMITNNPDYILVLQT